MRRAELRHLILILAIVCLPSGLWAQLFKINQAFQQDQISLAERSALLGYQLLAPDRLPNQYAAEQPQALKCGTPIIAALRQHWTRLKASDQVLFDRLLQRPELDNSVVSPSGRFRLHYNETGFNAVPIDDVDQSGVPDYVETAAAVFDSSYQLEVDGLGYNPPPADFNVHGPEIDVYFMDIGAYGYTDFGEIIDTTPENDFTSYMTLDNDFQGSQYFSKGLDGLRVTAAHELFHVIQMGYHYREMDRFFWEMSSTWMEDRAYDSINDYYQYLPSFLLSLNLPLTHINGIHEYGSSLFLKFIEEAYSESVIRRAWENIPNQHSMSSMDAALKEIGGSMVLALGDFGIWNYFTNDRSTGGGFYKDAANYPKITIDRLLSFHSDTTLVDSTYHLTVRYSRLRPETAGRYEIVQGQVDLPAIWRAGAITGPTGNYFIESFAGRLDLGSVNAESDVIVIAANAEIPDRLDQSLFQLDKSVYEYVFRRLQLGENRKVYPNPFKPSEHDRQFFVRMNLPEQTELVCHIMSETGRMIRTYELGIQPKGDIEARVPWDGTNEQNDVVASGIYVCIFSAGDLRITSKIALLNQ